MTGSGYLLTSLFARSLRPYLSAMNLGFLSFFILLLPELTVHAGKYTGENFEAFLDVAAIFTASAFISSFLFNFIFVFTRAVDILTYRFGKLWVYGAPGFASFLIFAEIPLRAFFTGPESTVYNLVYSGFFLTSIAVLLYFLPVFTGMNATLLFTGSVFARIILLPHESMTSDIFSLQYLSFQLYILAGAASFYLLMQIRYRYHLTPYYERFKVPYFIIAAAAVLWSAAAVFSWFQSYPLSISFFSLRVSPDAQKAVKEYLDGIPLNILLPGITYWILLSLLTNFNYKSRIRKNTFKINLFLYFVTFVLFIISLFRLIPAFPGNERISKLELSRTVSLEILSFTGMILDQDGDANSFWPGGDPDDGNSCIRKDFTCVSSDKKSSSLTSHMEERIENAKIRENIILITIRGKLSNQKNLVFLRSDTMESNMHALLHEINGMDAAAGVTGRSFISELAELGYRTICGGYADNVKYLSSDAKFRIDSGCQIYIVNDALNEYGKQDNSLRSVAAAMGNVYKKYNEEYTFLWIHYDSINNKMQNLEEGVFDGIGSIGGAVKIVLIMDPPYAEIDSFLYEENTDRLNFSLRQMIYKYMRDDPYEKTISHGPIVIESNILPETYASKIYRWRMKDGAVFPLRTAFAAGDEKLIINDYLTGIRYGALMFVKSDIEN